MSGSSEATKKLLPKRTALNLCKITLSRRKRNWISRALSDRCEILWPSSLKKKKSQRRSAGHETRMLAAEIYYYYYCCCCCCCCYHYNCVTDASMPCSWSLDHVTCEDVRWWVIRRIENLMTSSNDSPTANPYIVHTRTPASQIPVNTETVLLYAVVTCEIKLFLKLFQCFISHVTTVDGYMWNKTLK